MKKFLTLALVASLAIAGSAFAQRYTAAPNATFTFGAAGTAGGPSTTNNDDSCDIGVTPAATLLLPYFEVNYTDPATTARTTVFTVTNVSRAPQIAHVTVWTDWSFPVLDFNIFLTGYDVQSINLYDVIARGVIAPNNNGTTNSGTDSNVTVPNNPGTNADPAANSGNPLITTGQCSGGQLPGPIPTNLLADVRLALTGGRLTGAGVNCPSGTVVGGTHTNAIGYITIDLAPSCNTSLPNDSTYAATNLLFDNVLIGDYQDVNPNPNTGNYAGGNPMVHIRAIPEGGPAGSVPGAGGVPTNLPYTFYTRYETTLNAGIDRRQPLPSVFAARYIQGGATSFSTNYKIWREGFTIGGCDDAAGNSNIPATEIIRFDERENANVGGGSLVISPPPPGAGIPETGAYPTTSSIFPNGPTSGDVAGWMYLNLNSGGPLLGPAQTVGRLPAVPTAGAGSRASQNWVIISMFAEGRYSVDFDAAWLGNGCSGSVPVGTTVGPVGGILVCPAGVVCPTPGTGQVGFTGTNVTP